MNILILGGTQFVGRALVSEALKRGHNISIFNRGRTNSDLFPEIEKLRGDRDGDLKAIEGREWDAVIDVNGYLPRLVQDSVTLLSSSVKHYTFISTISVFASMSEVDMDENAAVGTLEDETVEEITGATYGPLKVLCENAVAAAMQNNHLIIRPGLIVGPHDHTNRFGYYARRAGQGGRMIAPGNPDRPVQFIDVRDLAIFTLDMTEKGANGIYNLTGPEKQLPMKEVVDTAIQVAAANTKAVWVDEQFLIDQDVQPWENLPFWLPDLNPDYAGMMRVNCTKAQEAGLKYRPLQETLQDIFAWENERTDADWSARLSLEKEAEVLTAWDAHNG